MGTPLANSRGKYEQLGGGEVEGTQIWIGRDVPVTAQDPYLQN